MNSQNRTLSLKLSSLIFFTNLKETRSLELINASSNFSQREQRFYFVFIEIDVSLTTLITAGAGDCVPGSGGGHGEETAQAGLQLPGGGGGGGQGGDDWQAGSHWGAQGGEGSQQHQGGSHVVQNNNLLLYHILSISLSIWNICVFYNKSCSFKMELQF